jgi:hypothetical protein
MFPTAPDPRIDALASPPAEWPAPAGERIADIKAVARQVTLPSLPLRRR